VTARVIFILSRDILAGAESQLQQHLMSSPKSC